jgi:hypothetical protein
MMRKQFVLSVLFVLSIPALAFAQQGNTAVMSRPPGSPGSPRDIFSDVNWPTGTFRFNGTVYNIGNAANQIPVLDSGAKLPVAQIPTTLNATTFNGNVSIAAGFNLNQSGVSILRLSDNVYTVVNPVSASGRVILNYDRGAGVSFADGASGIVGTVSTAGALNMNSTITGSSFFGNGATLTGIVPATRTLATTAPLNGGGDMSVNRTLSITDAAADGATKGAATFAATDFNSASGMITIDYTNGQTASASLKGFLTSTDWSTFNAKLSSTGNGSGLTGLTFSQLSGSATAAQIPGTLNATTFNGDVSIAAGFNLNQSGVSILRLSDNEHTVINPVLGSGRVILSFDRGDGVSFGDGASGVVGFTTVSGDLTMNGTIKAGLGYTVTSRDSSGDYAIYSEERELRFAYDGTDKFVMQRDGAITLGVWHGSVIDDSYIAGASTWNAKEPGITAGTASQFWHGNKTWATLVAGDIPGLATSKITSGTFSDTFIASAATWNAKEPGITAGTASQFWHGDKTWAVLVAGDIPGLPTSKITSGAFSDTFIASAATWNAKENALTFSTGLIRTTNTITVNSVLGITRISNLLGNGYVKTSGGDGTLSIDTNILPVNTTATTNQFFTAYNSTTGAFTKAQPAFADLSGSIAGGQIPASTITNAMLAGSIASSKLVGTDIATVGTITAGTWNGTVIGSAYGGTGVNNGTKTISLGANLATSGTSNTTLAFPSSGTPVYTFPVTSATLARTDSGNAFSGNQTIAGNVTPTGWMVVKGVSGFGGAPAAGSGPGFETYYELGGDRAYFQSYDRTAGSFKILHYAASSFYFDVGGVVIGNSGAPGFGNLLVTGTGTFNGAVTGTSATLSGLVNAADHTIGINASYATNVVFEGDSITQQIGGYNTFMNGTNAPVIGTWNGISVSPSTGQNVAVAGKTVQDLYETISRLNSLYRQECGMNVLVYLAGTNNMGLSPYETPQQTYSHIEAVCRHARSRGWRVIVVGLISRGGNQTGTGTAFDTLIATVNGLIRQNWAGFADRFIDWGVIGSGSNEFNAGGYSNTTYYTGDQLHQTVAGVVKLATYVQPVINDLLTYYYRTYRNQMFVSFNKATHNNNFADGMLTLTNENPVAGQSEINFAFPVSGVPTLKANIRADFNGTLNFGATGYMADYIGSTGPDVYGTTGSNGPPLIFYRDNGIVRSYRPVQVMSGTLAPTGGKGLDLHYLSSLDYSVIQSYDFDAGGGWKGMYLGASIIKLAVNGTDRAVVDSTGFTITGNGFVTGNIALATTVGQGGAVFFGNGTGGARYLEWNTGVSAYSFSGASLYVNGTVYTSSRALKQNIADWRPAAGDRPIHKLRPRRYQYASLPTQDRVGLVAEEVQLVLPDAVMPAPADPKDPTAKRLGVDPMVLIDALIDETQTLKKEIDDLKQKK